MRPDWAAETDTYIKVLKDAFQPRLYTIIDTETGEKIQLSKADMLKLRDALNQIFPPEELHYPIMKDKE